MKHILLPCLAALILLASSVEAPGNDDLSSDIYTLKRIYVDLSEYIDLSELGDVTQVELGAP